MTIPESQFLTWLNQGSTTNSSNTHTLIRNVLADHDWPSQIKYTDYLQGSYRNATNIYGESDVDIVVECTSVMRNNLSTREKQILGIEPGSHTLADFRHEIIVALEDYFGPAYVDTSGANSIKVIPDGKRSNRIRADIVACLEYRYYYELKVAFRGIVFNNLRTGAEVINYPKRHIEKGSEKNEITAGEYKRLVRIFKNARSYICNGDPDMQKKFPSYFVECFVFNAETDGFLEATYRESFLAILSDLYDAINTDRYKEFMTQSGLHFLFGNNETQWEKEYALELLNELYRLWKDWYE